MKREISVHNRNTVGYGNGGKGRGRRGSWEDHQSERERGRREKSLQKFDIKDRDWKDFLTTTKKEKKTG